MQQYANSHNLNHNLKLLGTYALTEMHLTLEATGIKFIKKHLLSSV